MRRQSNRHGIEFPDDNAHLLEISADISGVDHLAPLWRDSYLTVRGDGRIDPSLAPARVLASLPWLNQLDAIAAGSAGPSRSHPAHIDDFFGRFSQQRRNELMPAYPSLVAVLVFNSPQLEARVIGGVSGARVRAEAILGLVVEGSRLTVVQRQLR